LGNSDDFDQESPNNIPSARKGFGYTQDQNFFYLFGSGSNYGDLWRFNPSTENWAWISGSTYTEAIQGSGTSTTTFSATNYPSGRDKPMLFPSSTGKRIRVFGGFGHSQNGGTDYLMSFFEFDTDLKQWRMLTPYQNSGTVPVYNSDFRVFSSGNIPYTSWEGSPFIRERSSGLDQLYILGGWSGYSNTKYFFLH
jgi:hypothetical protein